MGRLANIWFDLSALPHRAEQTYPYPKMAEWIRYALDLVGVEKLMWGTDVPGLTSVGTYPELLSAFQEQFTDLSKSELAMLFGATAAKVYRFDAD